MKIINRKRRSLKDADENIKIKALAEYLDIPQDEITEGWDENTFETEDGEEYIVCDYDTAYSLAMEDIKESYREMGLDAFTDNFKEYILQDMLDTKALQDTMYQDIKEVANNADKGEVLDDAAMEGLIDSPYGYEGDIGELKEKLIDINYERYEDNPEEYYKEYMDDEEFSKWIADNDYVDVDKIAHECIRWDGIAHFIATYDGNEIDLGHDLYAYRVN